RLVALVLDDRGHASQRTRVAIAGHRRAAEVRDVTGLWVGHGLVGRGRRAIEPAGAVVTAAGSCIEARNTIYATTAIQGRVSDTRTGNIDPARQLEIAVAAEAIGQAVVDRQRAEGRRGAVGTILLLLAQRDREDRVGPARSRREPVHVLHWRSGIRVAQLDAVHMGHVR